MRLQRVFAAFAVAVSALAWAQEKVELNTITKVQVSGGTITVVGSRKPNFTTFTMTDPARLVIDISEAVFSGVPDEQQVGNGIVTGIKTASYGSDASAIARVLIGFEKDYETDIQASDTRLVIKVLGAGAPSEPVAAATPPPEETTPQEDTAAAARAEEERKAAEKASAQQAAAEKAAADKAAREQAAAEKAEQERLAREEAKAKAEAEKQAKAEAEAARKAEAEAARQAAAEEKKRMAEEAAAERERKKQEAEEARLAAAEERKRKMEEAKSEAERKRLEAEEARAAAAEEKKRKAEEAAAERERKKQEAEEARLAAAEEKKAKAEEAAAERERKRQEAEEARRAAAEERERAAEEARQRRVAAADTSRAEEDTGADASSGSSISVSGRRKTMTLVGYKQEPSVSRVYVRTNEPVRYSVSRGGDKEVVLELENTTIGLENNARFLDTSYFNGAVAMVTPRRGPTRTVRIEIRLKEDVPYDAKQQGNEVYLDFQNPGR